MAINLILAFNVFVFVGVNASRIVFSLYALDLGAGAASVGGILATLYVFPLLLAWPIGVMADRFGARWLLAGGAASGACGMMVPYFFPVLPSLYAAAALLGLTIVLTSVLGQNLVGVLSEPHERTRNFSNYSLTGSIAIFLGPLMAGFAIDHVGHSQACLAVSILLLFAVGSLLVWGRVLPPSKGGPRSGGNLLHTLKDRRLRRMLVVSSLSQLGNDLFQAFLPIYAHGIGLSASVIGGLLAALAVGSFGVRIAMVGLIRRIGEHKLLAIAFHSGAVVFMLVPFVQDRVMLAALAFVFGMSLGGTQTLTLMLMFSGAQPGRAGETVGLRLTVNNIARILGPAIFGAVGAAAGLMAVFWINGVLMASAGRLSKPGKDAKDSGS